MRLKNPCAKPCDNFESPSRKSSSWPLGPAWRARLLIAAPPASDVITGRAAGSRLQQKHRGSGTMTASKDPTKKKPKEAQQDEVRADSCPSMRRPGRSCCEGHRGGWGGGGGACNDVWIMYSCYWDTHRDAIKYREVIHRWCVPRAGGFKAQVN